MAVSAGVLFRNEQASSSARTGVVSGSSFHRTVRLGTHTSQSIDCPLFKLLKGDLLSRRELIEAQTMRIIMSLINGSCELFLLVVDVVASLWVNAVELWVHHLA